MQQDGQIMYMLGRHLGLGLQLGVFGALDDLSRVSTSFRWWSEQELREVCERMGLKTWHCQRNLFFILFSVTKPSA
jgi:hypothetical protein